MWNRGGYSEKYGWTSITPKEMEVLELRADGHSIESISSQLNMAIETVKCHLYRVMARTHSTSSLDLISKYYKEVVIPRVRAEKE